MDLIYYQNVITEFSLFVRRCYLLKTVVLVTIYMAVVRAESRMIAVIN